MVSKKNQSRVIKTHDLPSPNNFIYRLFTNQRFLLLLALIVLVLMIIPISRTHTQKLVVEKEINDLQKEIEEYQRSDQNLSQLIEYLNTDQSLIEQAKTNWNLKEPGEQVVVIRGREASQPAPASLEGTEELISNLNKWWQYFFLANP
ncbi:MAG: septum formation initiator family protein [Patescibacteria group bacterium]|jgi:cell division protein FtsL